MSRTANAAPPDLRAPAIANTLALAALFAIASAFLFASYCIARALVGGFGLGAATLALSIASTAAASIFLWWLVPFADTGEIFWVHLPADRRTRRGGCPHCGYPHENRGTCTECGRPTAPIPAWTLSRRPVRRLAGVLVPALILGITTGELWMQLDESRFAREYIAIGASAAPQAPASGAASYSRARAFPTGFARMWADPSGDFHSEAWPDFERERGWKPKDAERRNRGWGWRDGADGGK